MRKTYRMNPAVVCVLSCNSRNTSVCISTRYGLDDPWIETRCWVDNSTLVQTGPEAHATYRTMGTGSLSRRGWGRGVNRPGVALTTHPILAQRLCVGGAMPLLPPLPVCYVTGQPYVTTAAIFRFRVFLWTL
jgi:hypothetical protein